ncbi:Kynureninase [Ekhidna lutea]|uniref:Kynureninase n=1 Tax=Ekhidna lutea TaxID=447679 RepID=A0A239IN83_EKHLU|nr:kynureninase [Ekhidna lutea]SNS94688.1 Kynureninase [Ekhidna lutea]
MKEEILKKAQKLDAEDTLASFRSKFYFPQKNGGDCIYLCGNSLGLQPNTTSQYVNAELEKWQKHGVEGHFTGAKPWVSYHKNSKSVLAKILGAKEDEVVAMNNLTTNLHLAMASFYRPNGKRTKILIERGAFPSDFYAVHSRIKVSGQDPDKNLIELEPTDGSDYLSTAEITAKIEELSDELALVMFPGVQYYTGQLFDIDAITKAAHKVGAYAGFDLAHAAGNVPMQLHDTNVDFAVWCTYKYLNSGPGGVGGLFIHEKHGQNIEMPRLSGWWGHDSESRFKMKNQINPIPTVDGWQLSNVNILSHASHLASLDIFDQAGIENLRAKSIKLTDFMESVINSSEVLTKNIKVLTPGSSNERGAQLSLYLINHGKSVFEFLLDNGAILDWREPNVIRVAPVPLYNSFTDVVNFVSILEKAIINEG